MTCHKIALIDDAFPKSRNGGFSGRKHAEFAAFLNLIPEVITACPPRQFTNLRDRTDFQKDRDLFAEIAGFEKAARVTFCEDLSDLNADLAYCVFPHYAYKLLPWFELNRIPFAFTIYPGGGFLMWGNGQGASDERLRKLFASKYFSGVFVHHRIIKNYLESAHGLTDKILFLKGGFSQMDARLVRPKSHFGFEHETMNICFVANRYDPMGLGKGYDIFIEAARKLSRLRSDCSFHVVGDWSEDIIDVSDFRERIQFHGYLKMHELAQFYSGMDAIVSPTRIDVPVEGKFDGFPLVVDAGICGVAMFATDPLDQNEDFVAGTDLEIVAADPEDVAARLLPYFTEPQRLKDLAINGQKRINELRNKEAKLAAKAQMLRRLLLRVSSV